MHSFFVQDHLRNLRLSFREPRPATTITATIELANAPLENARFVNVQNTRVVDANARTGSYSAKLNNSGSTPTALDPWKSFQVKQGDKLKAEACARYAASSTSGSINWSLYLSNAANTTTGSESSKNIPLLQMGIATNNEFYVQFFSR